MLQSYKKTFFNNDSLILANSIESKSDDLFVFWSNKFILDIDFFSLKIYISKSKKFNLLEEFILKACIELQEKISIKELSEIFGLDPVFIIETVKILSELETIKITKKNIYSDTISLDTIISITNLGKDFYKEGCIPAPSTPLTIFGYINPLDNSFNFVSSKTLFDINTNIVDNSLQNISEYINFTNNININEFDLDKWFEVFKLYNLNYQLKENERITGVKILDINKIKTEISLIYFFDNIKNEIKVKAKLAIEQNFNESISNILTKYINENLDNNGLINFEKLKNEIQNYFSINGKDIFVNKYKELLINNKKINKISYFEYDKEFFETMENAKNSILIYLPILNSFLFNDNIISLIIKLLKKGVNILIGYGENKIPFDEIKKIQETDFSENKEGIIIIHKIGDYPIKEIIIDKKVSFIEYLNHINYYNNLIPLGENVIKITDKELINKQINYWENEYLNLIVDSINKSFDKNDYESIIEYMNVLFYFNKYEILEKYLLKIDEKKILALISLIINKLKINSKNFNKLKNILDKLQIIYNKNTKIKEFLSKFN